ncbi:hypothetical protein DdX_22145 [Ditylenchus destructor]|uniref:Uncharacterized protein n=1 Tax=Ditylenchus destructor TaxID=166010 RepID=A0AAD4QV18_9BILA|nr:hypothetical protein DdX_22145 [Ditylenchus destructor]
MIEFHANFYTPNRYAKLLDAKCFVLPKRFKIVGRTTIEYVEDQVNFHLKSGRPLMLVGMLDQSPIVQDYLGISHSLTDLHEQLRLDSICPIALVATGNMPVTRESFCITLDADEKLSQTILKAAPLTNDPATGKRLYLLIFLRE